MNRSFRRALDDGDLNDWALAGVAGLVGALTLARMVVFWPNDTYLNTTSGAWTALATDLLDGVFYRPLFGPDGYGGTRYFPLHFVLHAGLIKLVGNPIWAGYLMSAFSTLLLMTGVAAFLRRSGATRLSAASCAVLMMASQVMQEALLSVRGDVLPVGLTVWGLVFCVASPRYRAGSLLTASAFFTLAFASKLTAVAGVVASVGWLVRTRRHRDAVVILCATGVGVLLVLGTIQLASGGTAINLLLQSGASGAGLRALLRAPLSLARVAREVPETLVFIELGLAAVLTMNIGSSILAHLTSCYFAAALLTTSVIFSAEGADVNHLVELQAASILAIGSWIVSRVGARKTLDLGVSVLAIGAVAASLSLASGLVNWRSEQRWGRLDRVIAQINGVAGPVLAENSLVPVMAGQRPYVLDSYMFRILKDRDPAFAGPLWDKLGEQWFATVVLERDPHTERGVDWYRSGFFGAGFIEQLETYYEKAGQADSRVIYVRKRSGAGAATDHTAPPVP